MPIIQTLFIQPIMTYDELEALIYANLDSGIKITNDKHIEVELALLSYIETNIAQYGDIKRIYCDTTYLNENFDSTGLGKNLRAGWAICNGNNETDNIGGRVGVAYGTGFTALNYKGGEEEYTLTTDELPDMTYDLSGSSADNGDPGEKVLTANSQANSGITLQINEGGDAHNNMQPYVVNLYIMKI